MIAGGAGAEQLVPIPPSDRVFTVTEIKNFWVNALRKLPMPKKPSGLHPEAQEEWRRNLNRRRAFVNSVRAGDYDTQAVIVQLGHNTEAWRWRGEEEKAEATLKKLRMRQEHLARMELLEMQRRAATTQIEALENLKAIEIELSALRSSCSHACCTH